MKVENLTIEQIMEDCDLIRSSIDSLIINVLESKFLNSHTVLEISNVYFINY